MSISPPQYIEIKGQPCPVQVVYASRNVSANNLEIAAISGTRIKVMMLEAQTDGAATGKLQLLNGSGGSNLWCYNTPVAGQSPLFRPFCEIGYFETSTGTGLYSTITTTGQFFSLYYIQYTP
jgi:hypothetical protein